jgi:hypothetical protein
MPMDSTAIDEFRTTYIRDKYVAGPPVVALSHYNKATRSVFIDDPSILLLESRIETDYAEELQGVYDTKYNERTATGDDAATAAAAATAERTQAKYRVMRAEVRQMMMEDPGFVGSIADEKNRASLFDSWKAANNRDRTFARSRSSAPFASLPLVRY